MKRVLSLLLCFALVFATVATLASCGEDAHTHSYSTDWSSDETNHWHAATCEHTDAVDAKAAHVDVNKDSACDVCGFDNDHVHSFKTTWTTDEDCHWHAATCGCGAMVISEKDAHVIVNGACTTCGYAGADHQHVYATEYSKDADYHWYAGVCHSAAFTEKAEHTDDNLDGACDVCAYADPDHTHEWATVYSYDINGHWFEADCEDDHSGAVKDYAAHVDENEDSVCDTCEVDLVKIAVDSILANSDKVVSGRVDTYDSVWGYDGQVTEEGYAVYIYNDDYLYVEKDGSYFWYTVVDGQLFAIADYGYGVNKNYSTEVEYADGYYFDTYFIGGAIEAYGAEALVAALYEHALENLNGESSVWYDAEYDGYVINTTAVLFGGYYYYDVIAGFTLTEDGALETLEIMSVEYKELAEEIIENEEPTGRYELIATDDDIYNEYYVSVSQYGALENTFAPAVVPEEVLANSFDITYNDGENDVTVNADTVIDMVLGEGAINFGITNVDNENADFNFDNFSYTVYDAEGNETENAVSLNLAFDYENGVTFIEMSHTYSPVAGTYTVKFSTYHVEKEFKVTLIIPELTSFESSVYDNEMYYWDNTDDITVIEGVTVQFKAMVNEFANNVYTVTVDTENSADDYTLEAYTSSYGNSFFTATKPGVYTLTMTSAESTTDNPITCTLTVTVLEAPKPEEVLVGKYMYLDYSNTIVVEFIPTEVGATSGNIVVDYNGTVTETTYTYDADTGFVEFGEDTGILKMSLSLSGDIKIVYEGDYGYEESILEEYDPIMFVAGAYADNFMFWYATNAIEIYADGTGKYTYRTESGDAEIAYFTYTYTANADGSFTLVLTADTEYNELQVEYGGAVICENFPYGTITLAADGTITFTMLDTTVVTISKVG